MMANNINFESSVPTNGGDYEINSCLFETDLKFTFDLKLNSNNYVNELTNESTKILCIFK